MKFGTVATFIEDRGFGFIQPDDGGADLFVHFRQIIGASTLDHGQRVSFESSFDESRGKYRAEHVRVLD